MSGQAIPLNSVPNEPTLSDLLDLLKKEIMLDINCHHVGTVQSFNAAKMTVQATVNYTKTLFQLNATSGLYSPVQVNYPILIDCPIICLGGGKTNVTFPIAKGDECLLLFNDRDIDNWYSSGQVGPVASSRYHAFTDAFALVGVKSTPNLLTAYDTVRALITNGNASVGINPSSNLVTIQNTAQSSLGPILQNIMTGIGNILTQLQTLANSPAVPGVPINSAVATQLAIYATQMNTYKTQLQGLLE
jgi:hypothetical protein